MRRPSTLRIRFFSTASDAPRARRPTDAVLLFLSVVTIALAAVLEPGTNPLSTAVASFVKALPGLLGWFWETCDTLLVLWAIALLIATVVGRGRLGILRDQFLAVACAVAGAALLVGDGASVVDGLTATNPPPIDPAVRLALATAVVVTTGPHLGRPVRRVGRWLVPLAALSEIALAITTPLGVVTGLALGYGAGALVHLVFGSSGGRPTAEEVTDALLDLGIEVTEIHAAALEPRGVAQMEASTADGPSLLVKVYGRDAWDGQLLNVTWSYLWYRDDTPNLTLSRLQQVEHEAFVTLLAERAGVPVQPVVAAGNAEEDALLVVETRGRRLSSIGDEISDELLRDLWRSAGRMHEAGIAHGALDDGHLAVLPDGTGVFGGFAGATAAASSLRFGSDRAQLLVTTALRAGAERAVAAARAELDAEGLADLLPYLQSAALTRPTRRALKDTEDLLEDVRARAAEAAGTEPPKLEPLRRVTWGSLLIVALLLFAVWAVFSAVSDVGLQTIVDELDAADAGWIWAALLVSLLVQFAEAFSTLGACPIPLRLGPVIGLQFAIRFIALAVPSSAGRVALNVRFFQRAGLATSPAVAVGLVDSVAGFVVQIFLLLVIWIAGLGSLTISTKGVNLDIDSQTIVAVVIVAVILIALVFTIPKVRRTIRPRLSEAAEALQVLRMPAKDLELFAGNLVAQVILAVVLGLCLRAFGAHTSLANLILINTLASLFSGVIPIPGGIGVMEAAISAGLVAAGIQEPTAVSAALVYRLITFYLPPIWGGYAMRVLRRREYL